MPELDIITIKLQGDEDNFLLKPKAFSTGSRGYHAFGKMMAGGKKYQINVNVVEIGSNTKPKGR